MSYWRIWLKVVFLAGILLFGRAALAAPVTCSYGYQDSTCGSFLSNAPQAAPTCPGSAGWTTAVAAKWIGSQYSAPQCSYQAAPTCPTGYTQTVAPAWNGSSWGSPGCVLLQVGGIPTGTPESQVCLGALATIDPWGTPDNGFMHWSSDLAAGQALFGSLSGPVAGSGSDTFNAWFNSLPWGNIAQIQQQYGTGAPAGNADMWTGGDGNGGLAACWVAPGTTNVLGTYYILPTYETNGG